MLLAINAGNTHVTLAVCDPANLDETGRARWKWRWKVASDVRRTEDEYGAFLHSVLASSGLSDIKFDGLSISTVVPRIGETLERLAQSWKLEKVFQAGPETDSGLELRYPAHELGPDRLVNAAAAWHLYGGLAIVVDFGTATTFDVVTGEGVYLGGAISPGLELQVDALAQRAARLFRVDLTPPPFAIGRSSAESLQSGIVLGAVEQADGLIRRMIEELGEESKVIATGGLADIIAPLSRTIQQVDPWLTLEGLRLLWQRAFSEG